MARKRWRARSASGFSGSHPSPLHPYPTSNPLFLIAFIRTGLDAVGPVACLLTIRNPRFLTMSTV